MPSKQSISYRLAGISILSCGASCLPLTMGRSVLEVSSSSSRPKSKHSSSNWAVVYLAQRSVSMVVVVTILRRGAHSFPRAVKSWALSTLMVGIVENVDDDAGVDRAHDLKGE
jgi:hypothetical protein